MYALTRIAFRIVYAATGAGSWRAGARLPPLGAIHDDGAGVHALYTAGQRAVDRAGDDMAATIAHLETRLATLRRIQEEVEPALTVADLLRWILDLADRLGVERNGAGSDLSPRPHATSLLRAGLTAGDGSKGARLYDWAFVPLAPPATAGFEQGLLNWWDGKAVPAGEGVML